MSCFYIVENRDYEESAMVMKERKREPMRETDLVASSVVRDRGRRMIIHNHLEIHVDETVELAERFDKDGFNNEEI